MKELEQRIFSIQNTMEFEALALDVFHYQYAQVPVYRDFVNLLGTPSPHSLAEIPFLPIEFFKSQQIIADGHSTEILFKSSGTQGVRSQHFVAKSQLYKNAFNQGYDALMGPAEDQVILALLPNYLEQGNSSLVYMVDHLIQRSAHPLSGFFLNESASFQEHYKLACKEGKKVVVFGVSYALLDLADQKVDLSKAQIVETGGMKGRREELTKSALHARLQAGLNCQLISSEYGMTELLSQAYSLKDGTFRCSPTLKILIRDSNDPLSYVEDGKSGGINVIDLANLYSCSFIETQDLGRIHDDQFEILGRIDLADQRGCNLMIQ